MIIYRIGSVTDRHHVIKKRIWSPPTHRHLLYKQLNALDKV
jgi:hypothetical protein